MITDGDDLMFFENSLSKNETSQRCDCRNRRQRKRWRGHLRLHREIQLSQARKEGECSLEKFHFSIPTAFVECLLSLLRFLPLIMQGIMFLLLFLPLLQIPGMEKE